MNYIYHVKQILRTPLKPFKTSFTKEELQHLFNQKEAQEALFLSSPNLLSEFAKWKNGGITDKAEEESLIYALLKYALRMHSRCTPFGLFAGCGIVKGFSNSYEILPFGEMPIGRGERNTRLDMNFTCALAQELAQLPFIKKHLKFYPNGSSYNLQDKIRYVEYYYKDKRRIHQISAVDSSIYIQKILHAAKQGATLNELATIIVEDEISVEEALTFVTQIADAQLLVSELEPAVTGEELLTQILNLISPLEGRLRGVISSEDTKEFQNIIKLLQNTQTQLNNIDKVIGNNIAVYEELAENLKQLNIPFELSKLFQTDLYISPLERGAEGGVCNLDLVLKDVCFRYIGTSEEVLKGLNLTIPAHKITAIVGSSGSGKTTLMKMLLKFYEPVNGTISVGAINLNNISQYSWRSKSGTVMQEGFIFNDTIANNIAVGEDYINKEKLVRAVEVANIREFIEGLPLAYNTKIGASGVGMSTGQKQRLLIARAVYKNPEIIFFDEATSALDAKNERIIMDNLNEFFKGRTAVIIAHRLSTVKNADQIVVLEQGHIIEKGTHLELIALKGSYYNLVKNQLELEKLTSSPLERG